VRCWYAGGAAAVANFFGSRHGEFDHHGGGGGGGGPAAAAAAAGAVVDKDWRQKRPATRALVVT
jgi:hypothetical protein